MQYTDTLFTKQSKYANSVETNVIDENLEVFEWDVWMQTFEILAGPAFSFLLSREIFLAVVSVICDRRLDWTYGFDTRVRKAFSLTNLNIYNLGHWCI